MVLIHAQVTMNATLLVPSCVGNIIGPLIFTGKSAPNYITAKLTIVVVSSAAIGFTLVFVLYYSLENKRSDKLAREGKVEYKKNIEVADINDRKNFNFQYQL